MKVDIKYCVNNYDKDSIIQCLEMLGIRPWNFEYALSLMSKFDDGFLGEYLDWYVEYPKVTSVLNAQVAALVALYVKLPDTIKDSMQHKDFYEQIVSPITQRTYAAYAKKMAHIKDVTMYKTAPDAYISISSGLKNIALCNLPTDSQTAFYINTVTTRFANMKLWKVSKQRARAVYNLIYNSNDRSGLLPFMIINHEHFKYSQINEFLGVKSKPATDECQRAIFMSPDFYLSKTFNKLSANRSGMLTYDNVMSHADISDFSEIDKFLVLLPKDRLHVYALFSRYMKTYNINDIRKNYSPVNVAEYRSSQSIPDQIVYLEQLGMLTGKNHRSLKLDKFIPGDPMNKAFGGYILGLNKEDVIEMVTSGLERTRYYDVYKLGLKMIIHKRDALINHYAVPGLYEHNLVTGVGSRLAKKDVILCNVAGDKSDARSIATSVVNDFISKYSDTIVYLYRIPRYDLTGRFTCGKGAYAICWPNESIVRWNYMKYPSVFRVEDNYGNVSDINLYIRVIGGARFLLAMKRAINRNDTLSDVDIVCDK